MPDQPEFGSPSPEARCSVQFMAMLRDFHDILEMRDRLIEYRTDTDEFWTKCDDYIDKCLEVVNDPDMRLIYTGEIRRRVLSEARAPEQVTNLVETDVVVTDIHSEYATVLYKEPGSNDLSLGMIELPSVPQIQPVAAARASFFAPTYEDAINLKSQPAPVAVQEQDAVATARAELVELAKPWDAYTRDEEIAFAYEKLDTAAKREKMYQILLHGHLDRSGGRKPVLSKMRRSQAHIYSYIEHLRDGILKGSLIDLASAMADEKAIEAVADVRDATYSAALSVFEGLARQYELLTNRDVGLAGSVLEVLRKSTKEMNDRHNAVTEGRVNSPLYVAFQESRLAYMTEWGTA